MPIIVKNNKKYGGTYSNATDVNYDNSVSKLNAGTSQEALDELADGLKNTSPVDNLLSTSTTLPLSANQGRVLDEKISTLNESLDGLGESIGYVEVTAKGTYDITFDLTKCRYLYIVMRHSQNLLIQPTMIPLTLFNKGIPYYISYTDSQTYFVLTFLISSDNKKITITNISGTGFTNAFFCGIK